MLLTYLDESYSKDLFIIAALACPDSEVNLLRSDLDDVVRSAAVAYGLPLDTELHGYELFQGKGSWEPLKPRPRARIGVYAMAFDAIAARDVSIILRGVDVKRLNARYRYPTSPHGIVLQHTMERVNEFVTGVNDWALLIADEVQQQDAHRASFNSYCRSGTPGNQPGSLARLVDTVHFAPSSCSRLIQAVDLVAFMHHRRLANAESDKRAQHANEQLWAKISDKITHQHLWLR